MALDPQENPEESQSREDELGLENLTCLLLQLFHNSSTTHIVLVTVPQQQYYAHCPCDSAPHSSATHIVLATLPRTAVLRTLSL